MTDRPQAGMAAMERFWMQTKRQDKGRCWLWLGDLSTAGYGRIRVGNARPLAHRFAYETLVGPIPDDLVIDHLCRNRACVNPDHLEVVTFRENVMRGYGACAERARRTHCSCGEPLTHRDLRGYRTCPICYRRRLAARARRWRATQKAKRTR